MHNENYVPISAASVFKGLLLSNEAVAKQRTAENIWTRLSDGGVMRIIQSQSLTSLDKASVMKVK